MEITFNPSTITNQERESILNLLGAAPTAPTAPTATVAKDDAALKRSEAAKKAAATKAAKRKAEADKAAAADEVEDDFLGVDEDEVTKTYTKAEVKKAATDLAKADGNGTRVKALLKDMGCETLNDLHVDDYTRFVDKLAAL